MTVDSLTDILRAHLLQRGLVLRSVRGAELTPMEEALALREATELILDAHGLSLEPWESESTKELDPTITDALRARSAKRHPIVYIPARRLEKEVSRKG